MDPRQILVVANQTACGDELLELVKTRMSAGPCRLTLLVPATPPHEHATWTEGEARAIDDAMIDRPYDEIILSTLPSSVSRWLKLDLPHRVEQHYDVPVTTLISQKQTV